MSIPRKKVLTYARSVGVFILFIFLMASCMPLSNYGKEGTVPAAAAEKSGQASEAGEAVAAVLPPDAPALNADMPASSSTEAASAEAAQGQSAEQVPSAGLGPAQSTEQGQTAEQAHSEELRAEQSRSAEPPSPSPLPMDDKPEPSPTVTAATYVPKASKKVSIPVLNYHSVAIDPGNIVVIPPDKLAEQMAYLHEHGYTPLPLETFTRLLEGDESVQAPAKPVLLTFDDGYIDNYEQAMPILAKYGFPATLFVSPGMTGQDGYLNWEQIRKLHEAGWDIQPHGMSHPHLPRLTADEQAYEIVEARKQIEAKLGTVADIFCYPYGEYNKTTLKLLKQHGFRYAFTIEQGLATNQQPPYQLKRIFVNGEENLKAFAAKLP